MRPQEFRFSCLTPKFGLDDLGRRNEGVAEIPCHPTITRSYRVELAALRHPEIAAGNQFVDRVSPASGSDRVICPNPHRIAVCALPLNRDFRRRNIQLQQ